MLWPNLQAGMLSFQKRRLVWSSHTTQCLRMGLVQTPTGNQPYYWPKQVAKVGIFWPAFKLAGWLAFKLARWWSSKSAGQLQMLNQHHGLKDVNPQTGFRVSSLKISNSYLMNSTVKVSSTWRFSKRYMNHSVCPSLPIKLSSNLAASKIGCKHVLTATGISAYKHNTTCFKAGHLASLENGSNWLRSGREVGNQTVTYIYIKSSL